MRFLEKHLRELSLAYYRDERPLVSDSQYDKLYDELVELEKEFPLLKSEDSPTKVVQSDLSSFLKEDEHTVRVLSLDKAYSPDELLAFCTKCKKECGENTSFTLEEKIDGLSLVIYYVNGKLDKALTRGNGRVGNDVTLSALKIKSIPKSLAKPITIAVRGEVYMTKDSFNKINSTLDEPYSASRNLASGMLRRLDKDNKTKSLPLDIFIYEGWAKELEEIKDHPKMLSFLKELGFVTNEHIVLFGANDTPLDELEKVLEEKTKERAGLPYDIDGLVLKLNNLDMREQMGYTEHHPRWAIAYKFESPMGKSKVLDIEIGIGRTGRITPVAILSPVNLLGATVTKATLHNQDYINTLELAKGDEVSISRRGDVIPAVEDVLEKNEEGNQTFTLPTHCPECGTLLKSKGANLFCPNLSCPSRLRGEIEYFASKDCMDIEGCGKRVIDDLIKLDAIHDFTDLYYINYDEVLNGQEGYKEKKIQGIKDAVEKSKAQPFSRVLASIGVEGVGKSTAEKLIASGITSFDKLVEIARDKDYSTLTSIDEIGEILAENIVSAFSSDILIAKINRLKEAGLKTENDSKDSQLISTALEGQVWCVTGSIAGYKNPDLALEEVKKRGARIVSSVSKKTTHLLVGSAPGSKLQKAIGFGTTLVKDTEYQDFLRRADE